MSILGNFDLKFDKLSSVIDELMDTDPTAEELDYFISLLKATLFEFKRIETRVEEGLKQLEDKRNEI